MLLASTWVGVASMLSDVLRASVISVVAGGGSGGCGGWVLLVGGCGMYGHRCSC